MVVIWGADNGRVTRQRQTGSEMADPLPVGSGAIRRKERLNEDPFISTQSAEFVDVGGSSRSSKEIIVP